MASELPPGDQFSVFSRHQMLRPRSLSSGRTLALIVGHGIGLCVGMCIMSTYWFGALALPERFLMLRSGLFGLIFLLASFAITPLVRLAKWGWAAPLRRPLALYGFAFIVLHLYCYAVLENALNWELIGRDLAERPAMSAGVIAFLLLVPLVVTSTQGWQRRLGKRWKPLHRLIYVALPLSVLHFYWLERDLKSGPLFFTALVGLLLLLRVPAVRRGIGFTRQFLPSNRIYKND